MVNGELNKEEAVLRMDFSSVSYDKFEENMA